jgi:hypothetical protein
MKSSNLRKNINCIASESAEVVGILISSVCIEVMRINQAVSFSYLTIVYHHRCYNI